jgi:formylglycine-generating enzyme required for sulfatase activity
MRDLYRIYLWCVVALFGALVGVMPVAFCQAGNHGGDPVTKELSLDLGKGVSMKLVLIPAGKFMMGNHDTGLYDMHGNVWEFCSDWYDKDDYSMSPSVDPENTTETDLRRLCSGSFHSIGSSLTDE